MHMRGWWRAVGLVARNALAARVVTTATIETVYGVGGLPWRIILVPRPGWAGLPRWAWFVAVEARDRLEATTLRVGGAPVDVVCYAPTGKVLPFVAVRRARWLARGEFVIMRASGVARALARIDRARQRVETTNMDALIVAYRLGLIACAEGEVLTWRNIRAPWGR